MFRARIEMKRKGYDILIVGGGVIGSSIAYHLLSDGYDGTLAILEKDPTYEYATTPRSVGGIRQQFSSEVNIRIGLYSIQAFERFDEEMSLDGEPAYAEFRRNGYLLLADETNWDTLKRHYKLQRSLGVDVEMLTPEEVLEIVPNLNIQELFGAFWGRRAGYVDPYGVLQGYLRKAKSLGAIYIHAQVVKILRQGNRVVGVQTSRGQILEGTTIIIAAGAWAAGITATAGAEIPVEPVPRMAYCFDPKEKFNYDLPLIIDPEGLYFRNESNQQIITGKSRPEEPGIRFDWDRSYFEEDLWPKLARWIPSFKTWALCVMPLGPKCAHGRLSRCRRALHSHGIQWTWINAGSCRWKGCLRTDSIRALRYN
jgi:glycine/D-amino acid oxidase-like deaminating enzyme